MEGRKEPVTYLEGRSFAHGGESPSTLVPCLVATAPPFNSNPPHPIPTPSARIILYYKDDINNLGLLHPEQEATVIFELEQVAFMDGLGLGWDSSIT